MKAAIYSRVSTDMQAEEGFSISAQVNLLADYCKKNNIELVKSYCDEGISGQKENRPEFQKMIKDAEKKMFDVILVHKFDRFARKVELSQRIKSQLRKSGVNVISITEPIEDSPIGFFTEGIMELLAEYYVKNLAQESKKGHVQRAKEGYHNGSVPFGYKIDHSHPAKMSINPAQAEVVREIFNMYNNKGYGCTKIAMYLNDDKIPSAVNKEWRFFTVNRILKNVKYCGYVYYDNQVYQGKHEPIISKEEFDLAQKYMSERTWERGYRGSNFEKFKFLGILKCGLCGCAMTAHNYSGDKYYYRCGAYFRVDKSTYCSKNKVFLIPKTEAEIDVVIKNLIMNLKPTETINQPLASKVIAERKTRLKAKLDRLKEGYLNGIFDADEFARLKQQLEEEINTAPMPTTIIDYASLWEEYCEAVSPSDKRNVLKKFINKITITKEGIDIHLCKSL